LGDASGIQEVVFSVQLYQWGNAIDVWGDGEAKRMGTPDLGILLVCNYFVGKLLVCNYIFSMLVVVFWLQLVYLNDVDVS
jgi:hypothetical protein